MPKKQTRRTRGNKSKYLCPSHSGVVRQRYTFKMTATTRRMYIECMAIMGCVEEHMGKPFSTSLLGPDRMMREAFGKFRRDKIKWLQRHGIDHQPTIDAYWERYYAPRERRLPIKVVKAVESARSVDDFGPSV